MGKILNAMDNTDPMPFGMHKGKPMDSVPANYLHWLWTSGEMKTLRTHDRNGNLFQDNHSRVADYIKRNLGALKKEHPDGIWS